MKNILFLIAVTFGFFSCEKALEIEPLNSLENDEAITTPADLANVVEAIYDGLQNGLVLGGNPYIYADLMADDANVLETGLSPFGTLEIYNRTTTTQIGDLRNMWSSGYSVINRANNVLKVIDEGSLNNHPNYDAKTFALFKGTALFARAVAHLNLVRFWGQPYDVDAPGSNTQLGVPYRLDPTLEGPQGLEIARNTVEEVYDFIINDLSLAEDLTDTLDAGDDLYTDWYRHKVDKWVIKAMLSRVYFFSGNYNLSSAYAEAVLSSGLYVLESNPRSSFTRAGTDFNNEQIFQLISINTDQTGTPAWAFSRYANPIFKPVNDVYDLFHGGDSRLNNNNGYFYVSFFGDSTIAKYDLANAFNGINMTVLRLAEMYLNIAESNISNGGNGDQTRAEVLYSELYQLRTGSTPYIPSTTDSLLQSIQLERRLELMFEGDRYHNLKRMKQALRGGIPYNDNSLLFKIPQEEMSGNGLMVQNP